MRHEHLAVIGMRLCVALIIMIFMGHVVSTDYVTDSSGLYSH